MMAAPGNTTQLYGSTSEQKTQCSQLFNGWPPGANNPCLEATAAEHLALTEGHIPEVIAGGDRNPKIHTLFERADADISAINWINADLVAQSAPRA